MLSLEKGNLPWTILARLALPPPSGLVQYRLIKILCIINITLPQFYKCNIPPYKAFTLIISK